MVRVVITKFHSRAVFDNIFVTLVFFYFFITYKENKWML